MKKCAINFHSDSNVILNDSLHTWKYTSVILMVLFIFLIHHICEKISQLFSEHNCSHWFITLIKIYFSYSQSIVIINDSSYLWKNISIILRVQLLSLIYHTYEKIFQLFSEHSYYHWFITLMKKDLSNSNNVIINKSSHLWKNI
jgi:hypothetical protein